jgi:hypothetical protein
MIFWRESARPKDSMKRTLSKDPGETRPWLPWILVLILMGVALALRWRYIREISLYVDEFVTAWAARNVLYRGLPIFPSGNVYPHGFVFTYLEAPFVLGEFHETLARIPGLLVSLVGLPVAYLIGRKLLDDRVGLSVAAALAVDPDCILWGGRARMYGLLQLLTLLIVYFYYRGLVRDRPRDRYLAMVLVIAAIFTHLEATFLLPALGLATILILPWRRIWRWSVILPFAIASVGAVIFLLIAKFGQPGHLETLQESRPYLDFTGAVLTGPLVFAPVFTGLHRLPFTLLAIVGAFLLFWPRLDRRAPLTYLYAILIAVLVPLLVLAGPTWQNERYLFLLLPIFFLIGGMVLIRLLDLAPMMARILSWQPGLLALLIAMFVGLSGSGSAYAQEWGYDLAFRYVRDQWNPDAGDRVATLSPSACALYLGQCDHFAIQRGYEEFIVRRPGDGLPADLWTATPLLTDTVDFVELLRTSPRVWFVSDGWRFQTRYDADFIQTVIGQMSLEYNERGVLVFRGQGYAPLPELAVGRDRWVEFDGQIALTGFSLSSANPSPGDELQIELSWQALDGAGPAYTALLHLLAPDGTGVAGIDEPVLRELYQPDLWPAEQALADRHRLKMPADLPPGRYRLDLGLYPPGQPEALLPVAGGDRLQLATLQVGEITVPSPATPTGITFGGQIRLNGYDLVCSDELLACDLGLHWQALEAMDRNYTVFVHLVGPEDDIADQDDAPPGDAFFPTSTWLPGDIVLDEHHLEIPAAGQPGDYRLIVGLYDQPSGDRLLANDSEGLSLGDAVQLADGLKVPESP